MNNYMVLDRMVFEKLVSDAVAGNNCGGCSIEMVASSTPDGITPT